MIIKLIRYAHRIPKVYPFCLFNASLGYTDWGILGCRFCQKTVDDYMNTHYRVVKQ